MSKIVNVGLGTAAGVGLGSVSGKLASLAINKVLLKKISDMDDQLDDMLSKRQLEMKSKLEKRSMDLDIIGKSHPTFFEVKVEVSRLNKALLDTLRPDQLKLYNSIASANIEYTKRTRNLSIAFGLLGGFAGGIIVSQLN